MFITYLLRELRRRMRQAIFIAAGLALGVGLVITVTAASDGVSATQASVLHSLYGVGTDVTVTQSPTAGSGGGTRFNIAGGQPSQQNTGTSFSRDILAAGGLGTIKSSSVTTVSGLNDVSSATGVLVLNDVKLSGTVSAGGSPPGAQGGSGGSGPGSGPGSGSVSSSSFTVTGVAPANDSLGPLASGTITSGHSLTTAESDSNVAVVDSDYAKAQNLKVGSKITVAGKTFSVIGIVQAAQGETSADLYIPLARAQALANMPNEVNTVYVSAASAADISAVSTEISRALPTATVTTSSNLASEVTGSLSSASTLANSLGRWLAVAVLAAAFGLASILTVSAVSRRVREFGTLKAMGWRSRRIIRQIMGEALVIGIVGGAAGVGVGYAAAALVEALAPPLTATTAAGASGAGGAAGAGGRFAHGASAAAHTVSIHLTAPVTLGAVALAVVLAIAGGLIAGSLGGWRAVRLRPAAALARVE
jgi:ABC-type lipoprotein release transport system permease subunit